MHNGQVFSIIRRMQIMKNNSYSFPSGDNGKAEKPIINDHF